MSHSNAWSNPSAISAEDAARMAAFLEDRARCPDQAQVNAALRDVVAGQPGERVLEVGCGSGALCRLVAPDLRPGGEMVGVDVAPDMIAAAERYAATDPHLRFDVASAEQLPHDEGTFDRPLPPACCCTWPIRWPLSVRWRVLCGSAAGSC
jgi:SAM-dependent methyltransferase